jgi:hypothetical protein
MLLTNNYGRKVVCTVCKCEDLEGYKSYTPPFANAIDSVYIGWCVEHKGQGLKEHQEAIGYVDRINQAGSNS